MRRECRLLPAVVLTMYAFIVLGGYLAPQPPGVAAALAPEGVKLVYWSPTAAVAVEGSDTVVGWEGGWLKLPGVVAVAACEWRGTLGLLAAHGPYTLLAELGPEGWRAATAPGSPRALACSDGGPVAAVSLGGRLEVLTLSGRFLVEGAGGLLEPLSPGRALVAVGAPVLVLGRGAILWGPEPSLLEAPEGWHLRGASATGRGLALYGSAGGDGIIAWLEGEMILVDAGSREEVDALSSGARPVAVVRVEGQVPVLLELAPRGAAAVLRYYPHAPMIYGSGYSGETLAGFTETLVGMGPAAVAARSLGYAPLGEAGVIARAAGVSVAAATWEPTVKPLRVESLGEPLEAPKPEPGEPLELRVEEPAVDRLSSAAAAAVLGAAGVAYVLRLASRSCPYA